MNCSNCGTENKNDTKFCSNCGKELIVKEGLGTASLVIGIIAILFSFIFTLLNLALSFTGLVLGIINKSKGGKKISGIILNIIAIVLSVVMFFVYMFIGIGILGAAYNEAFKNGIETIEREVDRQSSSNYVSGYYNCKSYDGSGASGSYIVSFDLKNDMTFKWSKYGDSYKNYVKGTYTYKDLDKKNASGEYSYYKITLDGDEFYKDGVKQSDPYASTYEFGITKQNGKKQGVMINERTYNMYYCFEE